MLKFRHASYPENVSSKFEMRVPKLMTTKNLIMKRISLVNILILIIVYANSQTYDILWQNSYGGTLFEEANAACLTTDNGYVIGGGTFSNDGDVTGNHGNRDYWVIKLDAQGDLQWQKCLGGSGNDRLYGINSTSDGGVIASGHTTSNNGNVSGNHGSWWPDGWVVKLDSIGSIDWQKCLGGTDSDVIYSVEETFDGGYIAGGWTYSNDGDVTLNKGICDYWIVKLDSMGNIQWQKTYGGSSYDQLFNAIQLADSSFIVTGSSNSNDGDVSFNRGNDDVWVVKLDANGNMEWGNTYGGSGGDYSYCIAQSANGGYTISAMSFSNDGDVSGGHGYFDVWVFEIDSSGSLIWQKCYGGSDYEASRWLNKTADGGNIIVGTSLSNDGDVTANHGGSDCWVIKTDNNGNLEWQQCYGGSDGEIGRSIFENAAGNHIIASWSSSNDGDVSGNHGDTDYWVFEIESSIILPIGVAGSISGPDTICEGTASETYSIDPIVNATSYTWSLDPDIADSIITSDTVATIYFAQDTSGYTTLSVFGSNNGGNSDTSYFGINIITNPTSNAGSDTTICENSNHMLNGSATSYHYTFWHTFGDGSFDDPFLLNATYTPGNQDISNGNVGLILYAFPIQPCMYEIRDTITLSIAPLPSVFAGEDLIVCPGAICILNGEAENYSSIFWSTLGDGVFEDSTQLSTSYYAGVNDSITGHVILVLSATSIYPCNETISDSILISFIDFPQQPDIPVGPQIILFDTCTSTEYHINIVPNALSYQWILEPSESGIVIGNAINAIVDWNIYYNGLEAYLSVDAINACGSTRSDSLKVNLGHVGISQQSDSPQVQISPNPSQGIFNISLNTNYNNVDLYVKSNYGRVIMHKKLLITDSNTNYTLDLRDEPSGIYHITFVFEHNEIKGYKLIKL